MGYGPQFSHNLDRLQPIDGDRQEDQRQGKRQRTLYLGRVWAEEDKKKDSKKDIAVPTAVPPSSSEKAQRPSAGMYGDKILLERGLALFNKLTTLEEKAAQLCFLTTDALYDTAIQNEVESLIQTHQIGGILFRRGEYRRQAYLVERYQEVSKTSLLIANDFLHGLSFYLQGDTLLRDHLSNRHYCDFGKAVMAQNRRLGVHIQFDRERGSNKLAMQEEQAKSFRKGIRSAGGIVGKEKSSLQQEGFSHPSKLGIPLVALKESPMLSSMFTDYQVQETIGFKTITFFDATALAPEQFEEELLQAFKELYDVILLSGHIKQAIQALVSLVQSRRLSEEIIDRHLMKALIIKSFFFR